MSPVVHLIVGQTYYLKGLVREMWDAPHKVYGAPEALAGKYLGCLHGKRRWHGFEVWVAGKEEGVIFMNDADLETLSLVHLENR